MVTTLYNEDDSKRAAQKASLLYVTDDAPGIKRKRYGKGFAYYLANGNHIKDRSIITRINTLAIPPAYENVWICEQENGHIQATGYDDKQRKQYRYHPEWATVRDAIKFERVAAFAAALPDIRIRIESDLTLKELQHDRVMAALVRIMETSYIRVGNQTYARDHNTYGLTTLRKRHVDIDGNKAVLSFNGKNNTDWHISLHDKKLVRIIQQCEEIAGYELFKYIDDDGNKHYIDSSDFNQYLQYISGEPFTAKDFRTWAACIELFEILCDMPVPDTQRAQQIAYNNAVKDVASQMGHTVAICKKSYLHPALSKSWASGNMHKWLNAQSDLLLDDGEATFLAWWHAHVS